MANVAWLAYDGVAAPGAVVLRNTLTEFELALAMARSGLPSPLKSPIETEVGLEPVANLAWVVIATPKYPSTVRWKLTAPPVLVSDGEPASCTAPAYVCAPAVATSAASMIAGDESDTVLAARPDASIVDLIVVASMSLSTVRLTGSAVDPLNVND